MKYFLYYTSGSCNQGDFKSGLEEFDTLEEARKRAIELAPFYDGGFVIIHGQEVT